MSRCPHCGAEIAPAGPPKFDPKDPIMLEGYREAERCAKEPPPHKGGTRMKRPYTDGTAEFYRFNTGLHHYWRTPQP